MGDDYWSDFKNLLKVRNRFLKETVGAEIFEIADVLAGKGISTTRKADGVFEFAAYGQDARLRVTKNHG